MFSKTAEFETLLFPFSIMNTIVSML